MQWTYVPRPARADQDEMLLQAALHKHLDLQAFALNLRRFAYLLECLGNVANKVERKTRAETQEQSEEVRTVPLFGSM